MFPLVGVELVPPGGVVLRWCFQVRGLARRIRRGCGSFFAAALLLSLIGLAPSAGAQAIGPEPAQRPDWREIWKWREVWSGIDVSRGNWLAYGGATVAPFGHIHEPGVRLRVGGGYGQYAYSGDRSLTSEPDFRNFSAQVHFGEALIGYLEKWGPLTAKAFGGIATIGHAIAPFDTENAVIGGDFGFKGVLELWLDAGSYGFAALDLSWNTAHDTRAARTRLGTHITSGLSAGIEGWLDLDAQSDCDLGSRAGGACAWQIRSDTEDTTLLDYTRAGVFLRTTWQGGELSASAGVSGGMFKNGDRGEPRPYGTLNWIKQF